MKIGLYDSEDGRYPNLALMKLSAWHKQKGDVVSWFNPKYKYDKVYGSKVFTWTKENKDLPKNAKLGGTGSDITKTLPKKIEHVCPDYSLYDCKKSYGFLTRGCPRKCPWCFVPEKEGKIRAHADIEEFTRHKEVVLMDNNILAHTHGLSQIAKISKMGIKVDFNQGLDARLIDSGVAKLLSNVLFSHPLRLACDTSSQIDSIAKAVQLLRWHNVTPRRYFCYVLINDIPDAVERIKFLKGIYVDPFAQPYRDKDGSEPSIEQKRFARWVNHKAVFNKTTWIEYK